MRGLRVASRVFSRRFFRELFARLRVPVTLVLDNFQEAGEEGPLHTVLVDAIEEVAKPWRGSGLDQAVVDEVARRALGGVGRSFSPGPSQQIGQTAGRAQAGNVDEVAVEGHQWNLVLYAGSRYPDVIRRDRAAVGAQLLEHPRIDLRCLAIGRQYRHPGRRHEQRELRAVVNAFLATREAGEQFRQDDQGQYQPGHPGNHLYKIGIAFPEAAVGIRVERDRSDHLRRRTQS